MSPLQALIRWLSGGGHEPSAKGGYRDELGPSRDRSHTTTGVVSNPRAQAYAELRAAEDARDSRRIGKARMVLAQETHNQLAREVWG